LLRKTHQIWAVPHSNFTSTNWQWYRRQSQEKMTRLSRKAAAFVLHLTVQL